MKKNLILIVFCIFLSLFTFGQETKRVLFIGNSYTFSNNLPQMLADVALSVNDTVIFDSNTPGGYTFQGHSTNQTTLNKIMAGNWDFVVLQEQSQLPSFPINQVLNDVFPYAHILDSIINAHNPCVETMFFMTWGRKNGDAMNCPNWPPVCTYEGMDSLLHLRYMMMAEMNDAVVSPVGAVWRFLRDNHPGIELYSADESHPSVAGTYATAVCFYSSIFRKDPLQISFNSTLSGNDADLIKSAVKHVVFDSLSAWYIGDYDPKADFTYQMYGLNIEFFNESVNADEYFWDFGDGNSSIDENPGHSYAVAGNYNITLHAIKCSQSDVKTLALVVTGIHSDDLTGLSILTVYPNPFTDMLTIESADSEISGIEIFDLAGRMVFQKHLCPGQDVMIDLSVLPSGCYLLKTIKNDQSFMSKIVKE